MRKNILGKMGIVLCIGTVLMAAGCTKKAEPIPDAGNVEVQTDASVTETKTQAEVSEVKEADASDFTYDEEDGKIVLTSYKGTATDIIIPSQIDGKDVYAIGDSCFGNGDVISVKCPDTLVEIREKAFINCWDMVKIELNDGLKSIDDYAFSSNSLEEIELPDSVESMGRAVFGAGYLISIKLPASVSEIPRGCFAGCKFESVTIPSTVKVIGEQAYISCYSLKEVIIEEGVEKIEDGAFRDCKEIESIVIPSTVTEIIGFDPAYDNPKATVTVTAGSYAEQYMKDNGIDYVAK